MKLSELLSNDRWAVGSVSSYLLLREVNLSLNEGGMRWEGGNSCLLSAEGECAVLCVKWGRVEGGGGELGGGKGGVNFQEPPSKLFVFYSASLYRRLRPPTSEPQGSKRT